MCEVFHTVLMQTGVTAGEALANSRGAMPFFHQTQARCRPSRGNAWLGARLALRGPGNGCWRIFLRGQQGLIPQLHTDVGGTAPQEPSVNSGALIRAAKAAARQLF